MGYTLEQFDGEVNSFLICKICEKVFMKPSLADCGCTFCFSCCQSLCLDGYCPEGHRVKSNSCKEIRTITDMVDALKIKCVFNFVGCQDVFRLCNFESHTLTCKYNPHNFKCKQEFETSDNPGGVAGSDTTEAGSPESNEQLQGSGGHQPNYRRQISDLHLELQLISQARDILQAKYEDLKKQNERLNVKHINLKKEFEEIKGALEQQLNTLYKEREQYQSRLNESYKQQRQLQHQQHQQQQQQQQMHETESIGMVEKLEFEGSCKESDDEICQYGPETSLTHYNTTYIPCKKRKLTTSTTGGNEMSFQVISGPEPEDILGFGQASPFMERLVEKLKSDGALQDREIEEILKLVDFRSDLIYDGDLFLCSFYEDIKLFIRILEMSKSYLIPGSKISLISSDISIPLALEARCLALLVGSKGRVYYHVPNDCVPYAKKEIEGSKPYCVIEVFGKQMVGQDLSFVLENSRIRQRQPKELMARMAVGGAWLTRLQKNGETKWDWMYFKRTGYESSEKIPFIPDAPSNQNQKQLQLQVGQ